jgi:hypothetical protein
MSRTTIDIAAPLLDDLRQIQAQEGKSLGSLVSELLAEALAHRKAGGRPAPPFQWISRPMGARVDLGDKDAIYAVLDRDER